MAATVNTAGGRFTAAPKRRRPGTRRKLSPSMQWLLSFLLMIVIFATYFVLCLLLTPYNLFSMTLTARKVILAILVILLVGLTTVLCIFGDWKRPLIAFLICLMLYIPANFSKIPEIEYYRNLWTQTAYSTMSHQGLMHLFLPWVTGQQVRRVEAAKMAQIGVNSNGEFLENQGDACLTDPEANAELLEEIEVYDPGFAALPADQKAFYTLFYELDRASTEEYLANNPAALKNGYEHILINHSALGDGGTSIRTRLGEKVLAIDTDNKILIVELSAYDPRNRSRSRGVLAVAKDPSKLHLFPATTLPSMGQVAGRIAQNNGGVLAMTGSGFIDEGGVGMGGEIAGFAMCGGKTYGSHYSWGYKRMELHENNWFYIEDAPTSCSPGTTDAMEFQPSLVVNGKKQNVGDWISVNPRACIGQSKRGEILMLCIEGRRKDSPGCSLEVCTDILLSHSAITAMNCDGGTTAILWFRGNPIIRCSNSAIPQGRYLPNAWVIVGN